MTKSIKKASLLLIALVALSVAYVSCNKSNNATATTIVKCITCLNGGLCINDSCHCPTGYEGTECQTTPRSIVVNKEFEVIERGSLSGEEQEYAVQILANSLSSNPNGITIEGFYDNRFEAYGEVTGYVSGDSIYIPTQTINNSSIVGVGYIHAGSFGANSAITFYYQVTSLSSGTIDDYGYNPSDGSSPSQWNLQ